MTESKVGLEVDMSKSKSKFKLSAKERKKIDKQRRKELKFVGSHILLHVTAGIPGEWEPTEKEMKEIGNLFADAMNPRFRCAVVTKPGVKVRIVRW